MEDLANVVKYFLKNPVVNYKDINMSYVKKYKLSDIANIINQLSTHKVNINIENKLFGLSYTGNGMQLNSLGLNLKDIEFGIKECYNKLV
jgi:hypothetical protein